MDAPNIKNAQLSLGNDSHSSINFFQREIGQHFRLVLTDPTLLDQGQEKFVF